MYILWRGIRFGVCFREQEGHFNNLPPLCSDPARVYKRFQSSALCPSYRNYSGE